MSNVSTSGLRIDLTPGNAGPYATHLTVGSTGVAARTGHGRAYGKGFSRQRAWSACESLDSRKADRERRTVHCVFLHRYQFRRPGWEGDGISVARAAGPYLESITLSQQGIGGKKLETYLWNALNR